MYVHVKLLLYSLDQIPLNVKFSVHKLINKTFKIYGIC